MWNGAVWAIRPVALGATGRRGSLRSLSQRHPFQGAVEPFGLRGLCADVPITDVGQSYQAPKLVARYPRDPRARLFQGVAFISTGDLAGAERELRAGLAETYILKTALKPAVDMQLRANLALVLLRSRRADEARSLARPAGLSIWRHGYARDSRAPRPASSVRVARRGASPTVDVNNREKADPLLRPSVGHAKWHKC